MFNDLFFPENHAVYEIMWKNTVERGRPQIIIWRIRIACWILKTTNAHIRYVILSPLPPAATAVARTCLHVTLYVHCMFF